MSLSSYYEHKELLKKQLYVEVALPVLAPYNLTEEQSQLVFEHAYDEYKEDLFSGDSNRETLKDSIECLIQLITKFNSLR